MSAMTDIDNETGAPIAPSRTRQDVIEAFFAAYDNIGGVETLSAWAGEYPEKFYPLFAKMLPSTNTPFLGESNELIIRHVLERSALDVLPYGEAEPDGS